MYSPALIERLKKQGRIRVVPKTTPGTEPSEKEPSVDEHKFGTPYRKRTVNSSAESGPSQKICKFGSPSGLVEGGAKDPETDRDLAGSQQKGNGSDLAATEPEFETAEEHKKKLKKSVTEKEESLRQMNLVKVYNKKHSLQELRMLTEKWLTVSQTAAQQLYDEFVGEPKPSMEDFLQSLNIPLNLIRYDPEDESFY